MVLLQTALFNLLIISVNKTIMEYKMFILPNREDEG